MATLIQNKHSIASRLVIFMVFFLSTIIASHFLARYSFANLEKYQIVVNKASEINDIAEQVVYHANLVIEGKNVIDARNAQSKLADNLAEYQVILDVIKNGGREEVAGEVVSLPACEPSLKAQLTKLEELWYIYKTQSEYVIHTEITTAFIAKEASIFEIRSRVIEKVGYLNANRLRLLNLQKSFVESYIGLSHDQKNEANNWLWALLIINMSLVGLGVWLIMYWIVQPLRQISVIAHKIGDGDLSQIVRYDRANEVGEVASALNNMVRKIRSATDFIRNIEEGNLDISYKDTDAVVSAQGLHLAPKQGDIKRDALATALINMRERMKSVAAEENERNWATRGLALFGEILQDYNEATETLAYEVVSNLVKYMDANQGALFLVNDNTLNRDAKSAETYLDLIASYAYNKRKHVQKHVNIGEGLVGQAFKDADTIYISDIPRDYADITSGLGGAQPRSILVVPLKLSDRVYGIVEIASFYEIEKYQIEFLEKLSENIASNLYTARVNENTKRLLQESTRITSQMQEQKVNMEKNMQILETTQQEMQRNQEALTAQSYAIQNTLITVEMDMEGYILKCNDLFCQKFGYKESETVGEKYRNLTVPVGQIYETQYERMWRDIELGRPVTVEVKRKTKQGTDVWIRVTHSPIKNAQGIPYKIFMLAFDITEDKRLRQEFKEQLDSFQRSNAIVEFSLEGKIIEANEPFLDIMGYQRDEIIGQEHTIIVPQNERQAAAYQALWHKLKQGNYHVGEVRRITKSGKIVWFQGSFNPILDLNGKPYKIVEVIINVTDRKNAEARILATQAELRQKEEDLTALINNTDDAIYTVGSNYRVTLLNDSTKRLFDMLGDAVRMGSDVLEALPKNYYSMWKGYYDRALAGEKFSIEQAIFSENNRTKIYLSVSFNPVRNDNNDVQGVAVFARDISARKQREMDISDFTKKQNQRTQRIIENQRQTLLQTTEGFEHEIKELRANIKQQDKELATLTRNKRYQNRSTEIFWVIDTNLEVSYYNNLASAFLRGWHIYIQPNYFLPDLFPQSRFEKWEKYCFRALRGEHFQVCETVGNRYTQQSDSILIEFTPLFNDYQQTTQVMISLKPITPILKEYKARFVQHKKQLLDKQKQLQKTTEKAYLQQIQTLEGTLQTSKKIQTKLEISNEVWQKTPVCTILTNKDGLSIAYNETAKTYLREWHVFLQPDYLITDLFPQKRFDEWESLRLEALAGKSNSTITHLYNRYKHTIQTLYLTINPNNEGVLITFQDITGQVKRNKIAVQK